MNHIKIYEAFKETSMGGAADIKGFLQTKPDNLYQWISNLETMVKKDPQWVRQCPKDWKGTGNLGMYIVEKYGTTYPGTVLGYFIDCCSYMMDKGTKTIYRIDSEDLKNCNEVLAHYECPWSLVYSGNTTSVK